MKTDTQHANLETTNQLAKTLGVSVATVNYYTNMGLFTINDRRGNHRLYDVGEVRVIHQQIHQMRKDGYSLRVICQRLQKGYVI